MPTALGPCKLHEQLSGPKSSSALGEVLSSLVLLRSERSESVPEDAVQFARPRADRIHLPTKLIWKEDNDGS